MPQGDKGKYTDKQKRMAEHIEEGYKKRGESSKTAASRAWATVNKADHGGKKGGSGEGKKRDSSPMHKGGKKGSAARSHADRSAAAKKGAATRKRNAAARSH